MVFPSPEVPIKAFFLDSGDLEGHWVTLQCPGEQSGQNPRKKERFGISNAGKHRNWMNSVLPEQVGEVLMSTTAGIANEERGRIKSCGHEQFRAENSSAHTELGELHGMKNLCPELVPSLPRWQRGR